MLNYPMVLLVAVVLLPLVFLVLPLALSVLAVLALPVKMLLSTFAVQAEATHGAELRRHRRIDLQGTTVNVTDGCIFCSALLSNISSVGICLKRLPNTLYKQADRITVFINDIENRPVLHVQPVWSSDGMGGKNLGGVIIDPPNEWERYLSLKS